MENRHKVLLFTGIIMVIIFSACAKAPERKASPSPPKISQIPQTSKSAKQNNINKRQTVIQLAYAAVGALKNQDMQKLAELTHPQKGIRFSPYSHINQSDLVFKKSQIGKFFKNKTVYRWGYYSGNGYRIELNTREYYHKFIYSADFLHPEQVTINEIARPTGMVENQFLFYPQAKIIEFYFSGFNKKYGGMDWQSIRLVFQKYQDEWYLVGIIHNQWTV